MEKSNIYIHNRWAQREVQGRGRQPHRLVQDCSLSHPYAHISWRGASTPSHSLFNVRLSLLFQLHVFVEYDILNFRAYNNTLRRGAWELFLPNFHIKTTGMVIQCWDCWIIGFDWTSCHEFEFTPETKWGKDYNLCLMSGHFNRMLLVVLRWQC